jgi:YtcA family
MRRIRNARWGKQAILLAPILEAGCSRAPSFDILGSFFPAWLLCLILGIPLTVLTRWLLLRLQIMILFPVLVYPSMTAVYTLALWLAFFR